MWGSHEGMGWWMLFGGGMWILFTIAVILVVFAIARGSTGRGPVSRDPDNDPMEIARRRYANGEISREEFEQLRQDLYNGR